VWTKRRDVGRIARGLKVLTLRSFGGAAPDLRVTAKKWSRGVKLQINKKAGENALREAQDEPALQKRGREKPGLAKVD